jgi:putative tricarboxylic transport membrane protein
LRLHDKLLGLLIAALGVLLFALTLNFPAMAGQKVGPSLFPRLIGSGLVLCGLVMAWQARRQGGPLGTWSESLRGRGAAGFAVMLGLVLLYLLTAERVGFLPVATVVVALLAQWLGVRAWRAWGLGAATALVMQWFFASLMRVPLPRGWFMQALFGG